MKNFRLKNIKAFTLIEMTLVALILGLLLPSIFSMYTFIIKSNREVAARQAAIQGGYELFERLNILMQDYSIDYEEYYNRQMVGCVNSGGLLTGSNFQWNVGLSGYCSQFTAYGNNNSTGRRKSSAVISTGRWDLYYCSSTHTQGGNNYRVVVSSNRCGRHGTQQSFGQYSKFFTDVRKGDFVGGDLVGTSDDMELGYTLNNIRAIEDSTHIQEIYLISHDGKDRLYFRRKLINQVGEHLQYKIQMLRLKGFDAGQKHNFDDTLANEGLYDGVIDTWACDSSMGFIGNGDSIGGAFSTFHLPSDVDDCWMDITQGFTTVRAWNISMSPLGDSDLFWALDNRQINPVMRILLVTGIYPGAYGSGYFSSSASDFQVSLETTINMKDFYKWVN